MLNRDYAEMLSALSELGCEFVVVGAYALAAHGIPRATGDIDVPFIGRVELITNKLASGRAKDLVDVEMLRDLGPGQG